MQRHGCTAVGADTRHPSSQLPATCYRLAAMPYALCPRSIRANRSMGEPKPAAGRFAAFAACLVNSALCPA